MLEIKDLHVHYGGIHAVQGVSMRIPQGRIVTLIGANGAGKSSVIRSISGLVKDTKGEVLFTPAARDGSEPRTEQLLGKSPEDIIRRGISVSPEGRRILPHLTVEENLMLGAYIRNDKEGIAQDIDWVYNLFPRLRERSWQKGGTLSGGEQQMLAVGRALMSRPDLVMLDEPSLGLAPLLVREIFDIILKINAEGKTVLLVNRTPSRPCPSRTTPMCSKSAASSPRPRGRNSSKIPRSKKPISVADSHSPFHKKGGLKPPFSVQPFWRYADSPRGEIPCSCMRASR